MNIIVLFIMLPLTPSKQRWVDYVLHKYLCSGYLRKETAVVSIVLPFLYPGLAHFAVHLKNSNQKKEEILRWTAKKRKKFLDGY